MVELVLEEFKQMHEHLREHEKAISSLTIVMITASAALLSAVGIFFFRIYSVNPAKISFAFSYLFLSPSIIVIPIMSAIRGHRESLYKMGLYIKVFFEGDVSGALWHRRLESYQKRIVGESHDSVPYFAWVITAISYAFFTLSLTQFQGVSSCHYFFVLITLVPLLVHQHYKHNEMKNICIIENVWEKVKEEERGQNTNA